MTRTVVRNENVVRNCETLGRPNHLEAILERSPHGMDSGWSGRED